MLAILLVCLYSLEAALYLGAGVLAVRFAEWRPVSVAALAVAFALGWRFVLVLLLFAISWLRRSRAAHVARLSALPRLSLLLGEYIAFLRAFCWLQPLERFWRTPEPQAPAEGAPAAVLFIHGFLCNGGLWQPAIRYLVRHGIQHAYTINLEPPFGSLNRHGRQVAHYVERICRRHGCERVVLVGHSMGGLAARASLRERGMSRRVAKVIAIGTPHHGTLHAWFSPGRNVAQLRPGNAWLAKLNATDSPAPVTNIYALQDNLVAPQDSARLENAKNIGLSGIGHIALCFSPRVHALLYRELMSA
jgi:pimeloyl-ACP methyl ester carboxylesterase